MELNKMIIGILLIILVVSGITIFLGGVVDTYTINTGDYDDSGFNQIKEQFDDINNYTQQANNELTTLQSETGDDSGFFSAFDTFLTQGYYGVVIAGKSMEATSTMIAVGVNETGALTGTGGYTSTITSILTLIIIVVLVIGIIAAVLLTKAPRL